MNQPSVHAGRMMLAPWSLRKRLLESRNAEVTGRIGNFMAKAEVLAGFHRYHRTDVLVAGGNPWLNTFLLASLARKGIRTLLVPTESDSEDQWNYKLIRHPVFRATVDRVAGMALSPTDHVEWADHYFGVMACRISAAEDKAMVLQPGKTIAASILNPNGALHFFVRDGKPMVQSSNDPGSLHSRRSVERAYASATRLKVNKCNGKLHTVIFADTLIQTSQVFGIAEPQTADADDETNEGRVIRLGSARRRLNSVDDAIKQPFEDFLVAGDMVSRMSMKGL